MLPFVIGLSDDLITLKPLAKVIAQCITASLLFFILDIRIVSLYGLFGDVTFPTAMSYLATLFTVVLVTNSLNLIDGIDGLASAFSIVACLFFGGWFLFTGNGPFAIVCLALAGAILAFLFQNWEPSNIFMGDTGSLVIGTILSVIVIQFMNDNFALDLNDHLKFSSSLVTAVCALIIPLADTTRVVIIRLYKRISPFTADKRHIHHALIRLGLSHRQAVYILTLVHIGMIALAVVMRRADAVLLLMIVVAVTTALCLILDRMIARSLYKEPQQ